MKRALMEDHKKQRETVAKKQPKKVEVKKEKEEEFPEARGRYARRPMSRVSRKR